MAKRQLDKEEKALWNLNIRRRQEDNKYLEYRTEYFNLMIDKGFHLEALKQTRDMIKARANATAMIKENDDTIKMGEDMVKFGVEPKEPKSKESPAKEKKEVFEEENKDGK